MTALPNSDGYKSLSAEAYQQKLSATNILDLIEHFFVFHNGDSKYAFKIVLKSAQ